jgi:hypothetical protein
MDHSMSYNPKHVQDMFWEAVQDHDPADRDVILHRLCSGDAELR